MSLSQARKDLTTLASLTRGDIAVSTEGDLLYTFPKDIKASLMVNSQRYKLMQVFNKAKPLLFYILRISFGVALVASLLAIFSTIIFLSSSSSSSDDSRDRDNDRGGGGGGSFSLSRYWGPSPFDFFYYRPYYGYYETPVSLRQDPNEMGFLESVFSYLFGDGNPNQQIEERRLVLAANMIRKNNGAVVAEQLAPFCDDLPENPQRGDSTIVDEVSLPRCYDTGQNAPLNMRCYEELLWVVVSEQQLHPWLQLWGTSSVVEMNGPMTAISQCFETFTNTTRQSHSTVRPLSFRSCRALVESLVSQKRVT